ncbi:MAG: GntR family transcriptional regulator [Lentisphaeria bacterium]
MSGTEQPRPEQGYHRVQRDLEAMIAAGTLPAGSLVPAERLLAQQLSASLGEVRLAVNKLAAQGVLNRVARKGTFVAATAAPPAGRRPGEKPSVAVLIRDLAYFYPPLVQAIEKEARTLGMNVVLGCVDGSIEQERQLIAQRIAEGVAGVILAPVQPYGPVQPDYKHPYSVPRPPGSLDYLSELPVPVVIIDHFGMDMPNLGVDCVLKDDFAGTYQATTHLIRHNRTKIAAFFGLTPGQAALPYEIIQRRKGYEAAMADHGLPVPELPLMAPWHLDHDTSLVRRHLEAGWNAFVLSDDGSAAMLIRLLDGWGVKVPDEVAVIGYDDEPFCRVIDPPLSSVRVPKQEMGRKAAQFLHQRIGGGTRGNYRSLILKPEVVARGSCGCKSARMIRAAGTVAVPAVMAG